MKTLVTRIKGITRMHATATTNQSQCSLLKPLPKGTSPSNVIKTFLETINMTPEEIEDFLQTNESKIAVEKGKVEDEKDGRHYARRIIEIMGKLKEHARDAIHAYPVSLLYEADIEQMYQICEYIKCKKEEISLAGTSKDIAGSIDRYELMNFGYDPIKM